MNENQSSIFNIIKRTEKIINFWSNSGGWAPKRTVELLLESRLRRFLSLTYCLRNCDRSFSSEEDEGQLILAWTNLGSLVEAILKLFLSVYISDYEKDPVRDKKGNIKPHQPVDLTFEEVLKYFRSKSILNEESLNWAQQIKTARNSIHIYSDKNLWSWSKYRKDLVLYESFLKEIDGNLPYP